MGTWIFMLVMALLIPVTMICFGARFRRKPPDHVNGVFGYRTVRSMASPEAWDMAHRLFGRLWLWEGVLLLPLTVGAFLPLLGGSEAAVSQWGAVICCVQILLMLLPVIPVEVMLHRRFDRGDKHKHQ